MANRYTKGMLLQNADGDIVRILDMDMDGSTGKGNILKGDTRNNTITLHVIRCIQRKMPTWEPETHFMDWKPITEELMWETTGIYPDAVDKSPATAKYIQERYTMIAGILPFIGDEAERSRMIRTMASQRHCSTQTVRMTLCLYLAYQSANVLAPKQRKEKELTADEKTMRWALNKFFYFVLRNIRLGATIDGLVRKEKYELPPEAIREMIINAHCHRNLLDESCIQVAVYDDRLEVTSPGGLYNGLTYEEVMNGHSKIRNKGIANIFSQMGLVEAWGSGIKRILNAAEAYGLPKPRFQEFDNMFRVELFRNNLITEPEKKFGEDSEKSRRKFGEEPEKVRDYELTDTQKKIMNLLLSDKQLSAVKIAEQLDLGSRSIEKNIKKLKDYGILIRHGSPKNGYWEIIEK